MVSVVEVLITMELSEVLVNRIREVSPRLNVTVYPAQTPDEIPREVWAQTEVMYTARVLPNVEQAPNLNWIQFHYAGIDFAANHPILQKKGLVATTVSGASASQVAEYVVMMLLSLGHHLPDMRTHQLKAEWPKDRWERFMPLELRDSTVGIVGYGSIGRQVARLLQPFGVRVLATKFDARHPEDDGYTIDGWGDPGGDFFYRLYPTQALCSMVKESDFVVVCAPLTPATHHLIDAEVLNAFKPDAFLISVARGHVIDEAALLAALNEHKLGGAALDVFAVEPLPPNSPLWKMPEVIITPHISGNSAHYCERSINVFIDNMRHYLSGVEMYNVYDPEKGY